MKNEETVEGVHTHTHTHVYFKEKKGITLVALVITIIVLIILAVVSINLILGESGILQRTIEADEEYRVGQAREKLVLVLGDAEIEKEYNKKYNQEEFLNNFILSRIENAEIVGDTAIIDGYAFSLDRSIPKIGEYIGKKENIKFPEIKTEITYAEDYKSATITITAQENENGISKIEILQEGYVIKEYTYENTKEQITKEYITNHVGDYVIKVYSNLVNKDIVTIEGLIQGIVYEPNGNTEYKKEYVIKVSASEDTEKVKSIKYQWLQTTAEPAEDTFTETCDNGATITENELTGQWYLWTLLETESGKKLIERSEQFYFDNQGPEVNLTSSPVSETKFTLTATATDALVGEISKYEFYVNNTLEKTIETNEDTATYEVTVTSMGNVSCYVIVTDKLGNTTKQTITARTTMYAWERWDLKSTTTYEKVSNKTGTFSKLWNGLARKASHALCSNGYFRINVIAPTTTWGALSSGYIMSSSANLYYCKYICNVKKTGSSGNYEYFSYTQWVAKANVTYSQGTTKNGVVYNANSAAYPTNGKSGSYWYVYKGIE